MGEIVSRGRSGAQGEFGSAIPVRPGTEAADRCLRGHLLTVAVGKGNWSHYDRLRVSGCRLCATLEFEDKSARCLADWCVIDPANQGHRNLITKMPVTCIFNLEDQLI
jgi:hypothetical protein